MPRTCMTCLESSMNRICTSAHAEIVCLDAVAGEFHRTRVGRAYGGSRAQGWR
jgi:hypothetical protein